MVLQAALACEQARKWMPELPPKWVIPCIRSVGGTGCAAWNLLPGWLGPGRRGRILTPKAPLRSWLHHPLTHNQRDSSR